MLIDCWEDPPRQLWDQLPLEQSPAEAAERCAWDLRDPRRWGLSDEALSSVGERL